MSCLNRCSTVQYLRNGNYVIHTQSSGSIGSCWQGGAPSFASSSSSSSWKGQRIQKRIDYFARLFVPLIAVAFNFYYWTAACRNGILEI